MGILSFFRRFRRGSPGADAALEDLEEGSPRCHHYTMVHQALRRLAFDDPVACLAALGSPQRRELLEKVWSAVDSHCARRGSKPDFEIGDVNVHTLRAGAYPCAVIEMPEPRFTAEAHFVAIVLRFDVAEGVDEPPPEGKPEVRYFTLECSGLGGGAPRTILCEWTAAGDHQNFGPGPSAELETFVAAVVERMESDS